MPSVIQLLTDLTQPHVSISAVGEDCEYTPQQIKYALTQAIKAMDGSLEFMTNSWPERDESGYTNPFWNFQQKQLLLTKPIPSPVPQT